MKNKKQTDFLLEMQKIDDSLIDEALNASVNNIKYTPRFKFSALIAAVLAVAVLASVSIIANDLFPLITAENVTIDTSTPPDWAFDENGQATPEYLDYLERQRTGGFARSDWEHLTPEDYKELEYNEDGIAYLEVADARQFVLDGTVIITDEKGEPFKIIVKERDTAYGTAQKNLKLAQNNYFPSLGFIIDGEVFKKMSGFTDPDKLGAFGLVHEFDEDTELYIFIHSDEPVYIDYATLNTSRDGGVLGGPTYHKYYFDSNPDDIQIADKYTGCNGITLEEVKDITVGNCVTFPTSKELLSNMKAGTTINVIVDFYAIKDKHYDGDCHWQLNLYRESDDEFFPKQNVQSVHENSEGANVMFEIPEDGDYYIEFVSTSLGYVHINSTSIEINE
ncbi:MAG: hypothetical protein IJ424_08350 [Oscillospiraceae bacterium]|nr:hypothetical protein [Oscillospiraceae bacterium]